MEEGMSMRAGLQKSWETLAVHLNRIMKVGKILELNLRSWSGLLLTPNH